MRRMNYSYSVAWQGVGPCSRRALSVSHTQLTHVCWFQPCIAIHLMQRPSQQPEMSCCVRPNSAAPPAFASLKIATACCQNSTPEAAARAATSEVLPTPGEPSSSTALRSCSARSTRPALRAVVGAPKSNLAAAPATCHNGCQHRSARRTAVCYVTATLPRDNARPSAPLPASGVPHAMRSSERPQAIHMAAPGGWWGPRSIVKLPRPQRPGGAAACAAAMLPAAAAAACAASGGSCCSRKAWHRARSFWTACWTTQSNLQMICFRSGHISWR